MALRKEKHKNGVKATPNFAESTKSPEEASQAHP
jgi:hypothetical protein